MSNPRLITFTTLFALTQITWGEEIHPQETYGTIVPDTPHMPNCDWVTDAQGVLRLENCTSQDARFTELGKLTDDDALYEAKRALLIELLDEALESTPSSEPP